jgi:hypothetical protein
MLNAKVNHLVVAHGISRLQLHLCGHAPLASMPLQLLQAVLTRALEAFI